MPANPQEQAHAIYGMEVADDVATAVHDALIQLDSERVIDLGGSDPEGVTWRIAPAVLAAAEPHRSPTD